MTYAKSLAEKLLATLGPQAGGTTWPPLSLMASALHWVPTPISHCALGDRVEPMWASHTHRGSGHH